MQQSEIATDIRRKFARQSGCTLNHRSQPFLRRAPMSGSLNCISGQYVKGYAGPQPQHCSRISADALLLPGCRFGALSSGCERYIRNGPATPTPGGATGTWYTRCGASAAKNMIRTCEIAPISICSMPSAREICHCACGVGSPVVRRNAIFPILEDLAIAGATDGYFAELIPVGMVTEGVPRC